MEFDHRKHSDGAVGQWLRDMTAEELAVFGADDLAYVKAEVVDGETVYVIHAANGEQMGMAPRREVAFAAIRQHEMEPLSVH